VRRAFERGPPFQRAWGPAGGAPYDPGGPRVAELLSFCVDRFSAVTTRPRRVTSVTERPPGERSSHGSLLGFAMHSDVFQGEGAVPVLDESERRAPGQRCEGTRLACGGTIRSRGRTTSSTRTSTENAGVTRRLLGLAGIYSAPAITGWITPTRCLRTASVHPSSRTIDAELLRQWS